MNPNDQSALWDRFRHGDATAFAQLYDRYARSLATYGCRISPRQHLVQDSIQDLFIELWRSREKLPPVKSVNAYLFKSIRYKLVKKTFLRDSDDLPGDLPAEEVSAETAMLRREEETMTAQRIQSAVKKLSQRQQEAVTLKFYHGFSNDQIAEIMGVHYQSATNILHRALLSLRQHFSVQTMIFLCLFLTF